MAVLKPTITKIDIPRIDKNSKTLDIIVSTDTNHQFAKTFPIAHPEKLTSDIIEGLKHHLKKVGSSDDEILPVSATSVHLMNEEDDFERIAHFLGKVIKGVKELSTTTSAENYMKLYQAATDKKTLVLRK